MLSPQAIRLAPVTFEIVHLEMTMWEIVKVLGPTQHDLGSGLMILGWESTDGRVFLVGGTSMCKPPLYARFDPGVPLTNRCSGRVQDKVPSSNAGARAAQLNR
jgi:hypothetical protein